MTIAATHTLRRALTARHLRTGHWFHELLVARLRAYETEHPPEQRLQPSEPAPEANRIIRKAAVEAAVLGTGAAAITTSAGIWTAETQGLAGLWAVPTAGLAMLGDLVTRAWLTIEMSCDVAGLFGVRFDPEDPSDLARLYAVAMQAITHPEGSDSRGHELLERLVPLHSEEVSSAIGSMAGTETLARNVVPVLGLISSGVTSYRLTRRLGDASLRYARARRALGDAFARLERAAPEAKDLLIEGIWFVFTSDARLDEHEAAILAHLVHLRPAELHAVLLGRMRDDEAGWLARLERVPAHARHVFLRGLETAAALDTELPPAERALLSSAARRLGVSPHVHELEALAEQFRASGVAAPAVAAAPA